MRKRKISNRKYQLRSRLLAVFYGLSVGSMLVTAAWRVCYRTLIERNIFLTQHLSFRSIGSCLVTLLMAVVIVGWFLVFLTDCLTVYRLKRFTKNELTHLQKLARTTLYLTMTVWLAVLIFAVPGTYSAQVFTKNLVIAIAAITALLYTAAHHIMGEITK